MEISEFLPSRFTTKSLPWKELRLMPIGDIQYTGLPDDPCDLDRLVRHLEWGVKNDVVFVGMGDYSDFASPSNRQRIKAAALYDAATAVIEDAAERGLNKLKEAMAPTQGRWLGLLEGHHFYEFEDGTTTDQQLARFLGAPFLGSCAMLRLVFRRETNGKRGMPCIIWAHHGVGGGQTVAAPLNLLQKVATHFEADIYLMGHQHKAVSALLDRLYITTHGKPILYDRTKALVATGSFLKGYMQGSKKGGRPQGTYVERRMLMPVALGGPLISITPRHHEFIDDLDIRVSV